MNRRRMHRKRTKVTFKDLKVTLDEFGGTLGGFRTDLDDVKGTLSQFRTDSDEFRGTLSEFRGTLDEFRGSLREFKTAFSEINETLGFIIEHMATKEDLNGGLFSLQTQINGLERDVREIKNDRLGVRVADLEEKVFGKSR
jgi:hypothetical protein